MHKKVTLQIVQHLRPGGIETIALDLMRFTGEGQEVHVVSLEGEKGAALTTWDRLVPLADRLHFLEKPPGVCLPTLFRLRRLICDLDPEVVHTHHIGPMLYGGLAARLAGVPRVIHTEHDAWHLRRAAERQRQSLITALVRPTLVADAQVVAQELKAIYPKICFQVIANGIDTERFTPGDKTEARRSLGLPEGVPLIGCAARLEEVKGHDVLLAALNLLPSNVHLALAGSGSLEDVLRNEALKLGIACRVHFLGNVEDMPAFYRAIDVFCLPSNREGMPLSPLEAQACGAPCVVTDVGGSREALCPDTGTFVPPRAPGLMAASLSRRLENRPVVSPRNFVLANGDVRRMARAYRELALA